MSNPLERLKYLPWTSLLPVAGLTTQLVAAVEVWLAYGATQSSAIGNALTLLYAPPLGTLVVFAFAMGMGALAVYGCELWNRSMLNTSSLWALAFCLLLGLFIKSLLPIPGLLVHLSELSFIAVVVGIFWKGRPYIR
ncbi:peptide chain release factor 1 [Laspinema olomoucense]|uniref:peptide chain release factor 1 n=1 Tax=Laspinema olomoucense TaxID=3231600 RepID=UPI0021BAC05A|nr:peptide chain release factor 1 [Laspinema sp. D3c]MCT7995591.1 peptide chain release factor 1 [Laspinema sp. D3c]